MERVSLHTIFASLKTPKLPILICLCFAALLLNAKWILRFDNKYALDGKQAALGILNFEGKLTYLIDDWELYAGQLLSPQEIAALNPKVSQYVYVGEYSDFAFRAQGVPFHGNATYRLRINVSSQPTQYTLELPEIFSAYKLWVNRVLVHQNGRLENEDYAPFIQTGSVSFEAKGQIELVFAVSNFSHYYSGIFYPPAFGLYRDLNTLLDIRLTLKCLYLFIPLFIGVFYLVLYFSIKETMHRQTAFVCFYYVGYNAYTLWGLVGFSNVSLWYGIEDLFFCALLMQVLSLCAYLTSLGKFHRLLIYLGFVLLSFRLALLLPAWDLLRIYGICFDFYKYTLLLYLFAMIMVAAFRGGIQSKFLLIAVGLFAFGIYLDNFAGEFEPILFGWHTERTGFWMVLIFSGILVYRSVIINKQNKAYATKMEQLVDEKTQKLAETSRQLSHVLSTRKRFMADIAHDLKSPIAAVLGYLDLLRAGIILEADKEQEVLQSIYSKSKELNKRVSKLQVLAKLDEDLPNFTCVNIKDYLESLLEAFEPLAEAVGVSLQLTSCDTTMDIDTDKLHHAIENILQNALQALSPGGKIVLSAQEDEDKLRLRISDNGCGISPEDLPYIFKRFWSGSTGRSGLGLSIVQKIVEEHGGHISVESTVGLGTTFTILLPLNALQNKTIIR